MTEATRVGARPAIGFIGLGLMGHAFTRRLCACGYDVTGYDIVAEKLEAAAQHGVQPAASAAEVTRASDIVQVCVMTASDLERAVFGDDGVAAAAGPGKILIDHSTTEVETTKRFAARLAEGELDDVHCVREVSALEAIVAQRGPTGRPCRSAQHNAVR